MQAHRPFCEKNGSARLCVARAALESHLKFMHHRYCWVVVKVAWHAADGVVGVIHTGHRIMPCGIIDSRHCQSLYFAPRSSTTVTALAKTCPKATTTVMPTYSPDGVYPGFPQTIIPGYSGEALTHKMPCA